MTRQLLSANHAAALAATLAARTNRKGKGFVSGVYPITPSTECMEYLCNQRIEKGRVVRVESEHSAMGVCIGGAAGGARSFTATSSNGLAYMVENCVAAANLRLPIVLAVANRTLGPPWNIWADQGDAMLLRDAGIVQFFCATGQEVFDSVLVAFRLAEDRRVMMPVMVCMEGFILSHTTAEIEVPEQGLVDDFLPPTDIPHRLETVPHTLGQVEVPHQTECHRFEHHNAMLGVPQVYQEIGREFAAVFGRNPGAIAAAHRADDAETLLVSMGTIGLTAERAVDEARARGEKVGALRLRLFRPLPLEVLRAFFAGKKRIAVLDRNITLGLGGVLWTETRALADPGAVVQNYLAGLGGGDVRPEHIAKILADIAGRENSGAPVLMEAV